MADMEIKVNRNPVQINDIKIPAQSQGVDKAAPKKTEEGSKPVERTEETLENVVSVSKDGDTVQVTEESNERLEEDAFGKMAVRGENSNVSRDDEKEADAVKNGRDEIKTEAQKAVEDKKAQEKPAEEKKVSPTRDRLEKAADKTKPDPAKERLQAQKESEERRKEIIKNMIKSDAAKDRTDERVEEKKEQQELQNITSFEGYTDQQLQQMVRKGQISQNDYNKEMEARSERTEAAIDNSNRFSRQMAVNAAEEELTTRQGRELEMVFDEDSADVPDAATRADILDKLQDFSLNN